MFIMFLLFNFLFPNLNIFLSCFHETVFFQQYNLGGIKYPCKPSPLAIYRLN